MQQEKSKSRVGLSILTILVVMAFGFEAYAQYRDVQLIF